MLTHSGTERRREWTDQLYKRTHFSRVNDQVQAVRRFPLSLCCVREEAARPGWGKQKFLVEAATVYVNLSRKRYRRIQEKTARTHARTHT